MFDHCTCHPPGTVLDDCLGTCERAKLRELLENLHSIVTCSCPQRKWSTDDWVGAPKHNPNCTYFRVTYLLTIMEQQ